MSYPPPPPAQAWGRPSYLPPPARSSNGVAVAALVTAIVALLGVIVVGVFALTATVGGSDQPLTGRVAGVSPGAPLPGAALEGAVTTRIRHDGGDITRVTCPDTRAVAQGTVTVCHATIDDGDWAVVVFFEDNRGTYTLDPI